MQNKFRGVMQSPVTPLKEDYSLDLPTFERLLDFHVRKGAPAISWPHHKAESLNLTIAERKLFAEAAVKTVAGRVPVTIHVSALAVDDTFALARHAQEIVKLKRRLNEIYAKHTGQSVEAVEKALDRDTYMTAEEAKTFGLLDDVYSRRPGSDAPEKR